MKYHDHAGLSLHRPVVCTPSYALILADWMERGGAEVKSVELSSILRHEGKVNRVVDRKNPNMLVFLLY